MWLLDMLQKHADSDRPAVVNRDESVSFKQLWRYSDIFADYLIKSFPGNQPVILYGNKDILILVCMLACLKSGRAYIPVDILFPAERIQQIIADSQCEVVIDFAGLGTHPADVTVIDKQAAEEIVQGPVVELDSKRWVKDEDNCYILFTSGSTGKPKGVQITKKNLVNFTSWFCDYCDIDGVGNVLNQVSYSFDVSDIPLYIYLASGKTLITVDKEMCEDFKTLFVYLADNDVSVWVSTPVFLEICCADAKFSDGILPGLKLFILAGEVLTKRLVQTVWDRFENSAVINGYGPTEGTVLLSACKITAEMMGDSLPIPIGYPLPDGDVRIIDNDKNSVHGSEIGELAVISDSISRGYLNNPEQTGKVFFACDDGRMGYFTGDLVFLKDSLLYYKGRKDFQIKLNGYRIEIEDIENNILKLRGIVNTVVLPVYKEEKVSHLVAFVIMYEKRLYGLQDAVEIKKQLKAFLPKYMIPKSIVFTDAFPMTGSGKVDRKALLREAVYGDR